jgi:hypothetical protein
MFVSRKLKPSALADMEELNSLENGLPVKVQQ